MLSDTHIIQYFKKQTTLKQFIKFGLIGVLNTLIDLIAYIFFTRILFWHYLVAALFAFIISASSSFILNSYWTFEVLQEKIKLRYAKFLLVALGGLCLTELFLYILVDKFYWFDLWAKIFTVLIVVNWNFFLQKYWTFKK